MKTLKNHMVLMKTIKLHEERHLNFRVYSIKNLVFYYKFILPKYIVQFRCVIQS